MILKVLCSCQTYNCCTNLNLKMTCSHVIRYIKTLPSIIFDVLPCWEIHNSFCSHLYNMTFIYMILPMRKVVLIGPGYFEFQSAELIRVILSSCWVVPLQNAVVLPVKWLSFWWVVCVYCNVPPLKTGTKLEVELQPWGGKTKRFQL